MPLMMITRYITIPLSPLVLTSPTVDNNQRRSDVTTKKNLDPSRPALIDHRPTDPPHDHKKNQVRYESVIHEFDPYFNFRTTKFLATEGFLDFLNWFDDRGWCVPI